MKRPGWAMGGTRVVVRPRFEPRDLWIGVYWDYDESPMQNERGYMYGYIHNSHARLTIWICILPTLPIRIDLIARASRGDNERKVRR